MLSKGPHMWHDETASLRPSSSLLASVRGWTTGFNVPAYQLMPLRSPGSEIRVLEHMALEGSTASDYSTNAQPRGGFRTLVSPPSH